MSSVKLSLVTLLPKTWAAYMAKELQAQVAPTFACTYAGPCAIGVGIPEIRRSSLDRAFGPEISNLIQNGSVSIANGEVISEYSKLQASHDRWSGALFRKEENSKDFEQAFVDYLVTLSQKYGVETPDGYVSIQNN